MGFKDEVDISVINKSLESVSKDKDPVKWGALQNMKGVILRNENMFLEAAESFRLAFSVNDPVLKCKVLINHSRQLYFQHEISKAMELINKVFDMEKLNKRINLKLFIGYALLLKGEIFYSQRKFAEAVKEFKKAEFYFESIADLRGTGLSCVEIARIHIKDKNIPAIWNYLTKGENCLRRIGGEELFGAEICKGVALYYSGREVEALELLRSKYKERPEYGKGTFTIDEIIDVYLALKDRSLHYQQPLL